MITQSPTTGNGNHDADYYTWLMPYNRVITDSQISLALASGLTVKDCHSRLLDAECTLLTTYDHPSWQQGWQDAVTAVRWLDSHENQAQGDDQLFYGDLRGLAEELERGLRHECYAAALTTGEPSLDTVTYSNTLGRCDCLTAGLMFVADEDNDYSEVASILAGTTDLRELRRLAAEHREDSYLESQHLIPEMLNVLATLQEKRGDK